MRSLLRGSHTVPRTRFTAPSVWRPTPASFIALIVGLWLFGTGDALILASALGASPWSVLAQGLSVRIGLGIGWTTFGVSVGVLALWIPLRQRPGLGTVMNIIVIALAIGVTYPRVTTPDSLIGQLGLVFLGWALGGIVGIGTALFALLVGQSVAMGLVRPSAPRLRRNRLRERGFRVPHQDRPHALADHHRGTRSRQPCPRPMSRRVRRHGTSMPRRYCCP